MNPFNTAVVTASVTFNLQVEVPLPEESITPQELVELLDKAAHRACGQEAARRIDGNWTVRFINKAAT